MHTLNFYQKQTNLMAMPLFCLPGCIILPNTYLPLNIFEKHYLSMIDDAFKKGRYLGLVQPTDDTSKAELYHTGTLAKIVQFEEQDDGRYEILLEGMTRFKLVACKTTRKKFRQAEIAIDDFIDDDDMNGKINQRQSLHHTCRLYFDAHNIEVNWESLESASDDRIVNSLSMLCPFQSVEKQALLEATNLQTRCQLLISLMEMAIIEASQNGDALPIQ